MAQNCCVPLCTKKTYRENEMKISFHKFPSNKSSRDERIRTIRRDVGRYFSTTKNTRVCSRYFQESDFERSLAGKRILKATAVPSIFPWKESSPKKRKPPNARVRKDVDASGSNEICKGPQEDMAGTSENAPSTSAQCDAVDIALEDVLPEEIISDLRLRNQDLERQLNEEKAKTTSKRR